MIKTHKYPEYHYLAETNSVIDEVIKKLRVGNDLGNKYLYLESSGAKNWENVENNLGLKHNEENLLDSHFKDIDDFIRQDSGEDIYDIVSLGCGTGTDDIKILDCAETNNNPDGVCSIITVDLSIGLLEKGTSRIIDFINSQFRQDMISVLGISCDFEKLKSAKQIIQMKRRNKTALFHLLGLTIGNYKERGLLRKIASVMNDGDYLLISVDICADDENNLALSKKSYDFGPAKKSVDDFLLGPLNLATRFESIADKELLSEKDVELISFVNCKGKKIEYLLDEKRPKLDKRTELEKDWSKFSDVKNTVALSRYYMFGDQKEGVLCDYSNKYKKKELDFFLSTLVADGIHLKKTQDNLFYYGQREEFAEKHVPTQTLILFKKINPLTSEQEAIKLYNDLREYTKSMEHAKTAEVLELQKLIVDNEASIKQKIKEQSINENKNIDPKTFRTMDDEEGFKQFYQNIKNLIEKIKH